MTERLFEAKELAEAGKFEPAWKIVAPHLNEEPNDPRALLLASFMLEKQGQSAIAYQVCKQLTVTHPSNPVAWVNLGKCCDTLWRMSEAEAAYMRALNQVKAGDIETKSTIYTNLSALYLQIGEFGKAEVYADKALAIEPGHLKSRHNKGLCRLAARDWAAGWKQYEASVGSPQRIQWNYAGEPAWNGEPGGTVVVFGEQGIGDEICAASMIPDAIERAGKVIIDCDPRLASLYRRSFPRAKVYGTRNKKVLGWDEADHHVDYSIPCMQMGGLFRLDAASFPGTPYLIPDPDRVLMWKALWASKARPTIAIAWSGGLKETASMYRRWNHDDLYALMRGIDANWVSLQYRDAEQEIADFCRAHPDISLTQYRSATLSQDYDDTAALVASVDCVVAMQSTAVHIAGALGVPCAAAIPRTSQWRYGTTGSDMPWYGSVRLFRQERLGMWDMKDIREWLNKSLSS